MISLPWAPENAKVMGCLGFLWLISLYGILWTMNAILQLVTCTEILQDNKGERSCRKGGRGKRDIKKGEGGRSAIIYRVLNLDIHSEIAVKLQVSAFGQWRSKTKSWSGQNLAEHMRERLISHPSRLYYDSRLRKSAQREWGRMDPFPYEGFPFRSTLRCLDLFY